MKKTDEEHDYLWDGSGEPDPEIVRLETVLGRLRHRGVPPGLPARPPLRMRDNPWLIAGMSAAAAVVVLSVLGWYTLGVLRSEWTVQRIAGAPRVNGGKAGTVTGSARIGVGDLLETDDVSRARIEVGKIGRVDVEPNSRVQVVAARGQEHRMSLARGLIHARIWAPPKVFFVNTPSATAIDLGCEYTLQVDDGGAGLIRVTLGWVSFEGYGRESFIPQGAIGATRPDAGPGTPHYDDAPSGYSDALDVLDFAAPDDVRRAASLDLILSSARRRDVLTLWHLLARGTAGERGRVYDRLAELSPPPSSVTRAAVLSSDRRALDQWWDSLGLDDTWWKLWKKAQ